MKRLIVLVLVVGTSVALSADSPDNLGLGNRVNFSALRLREAVYHNQSPVAQILRQRWEDLGLKHRSDKPTAIRLEVKGESIIIEVRWLGGDFTRFHVRGGSPVPAPDVTLQKPRKPPSYCRAIGRWAARLGFDAAFADGRLLLFKKFFCQGMNEAEFTQAIGQTFAYDLGKTDLEEVAGRSALQYMQAAADLRESLKLLPIGIERRRFDYREFSLPIQRQVKNTVELYFRGMQWQFFYFAAAYTHK